MSAHVTWREQPTSTREQHAAIAAQYRARIRARWEHPHTPKHRGGVA